MHDTCDEHHALRNPQPYIHGDSVPGYGSSESDDELELRRLQYLHASLTAAEIREWVEAGKGGGSIEQKNSNKINDDDKNDKQQQQQQQQQHDLPNLLPERAVVPLEMSALIDNAARHYTHEAHQHAWVGQMTCDVLQMICKR